MRKIFLLAACLAANTLCFSQDSLQRALSKKILPRHSIKLSPAHLLNFYPTVQVAYEYKVASLFTVQLDVGVVINNGTYHEDFQDMSGYKLKVEPRYYWAFSERRKLAFYGALELYRNYVEFYRNGVTLGCFDPECQNMYSRITYYKMKYLEHGFALKMGMTKYIKRFMFDVNTGLGVRFIDYDAPSTIYIDPTDVFEWFKIPNTDDRTTLTPIITFRIGYGFR